MAMDEQYGKTTGLWLVFKTFKVTVVSEIVRNLLLVFPRHSISYAERSG
jgi:hypothetical protein